MNGSTNSNPLGSWMRSGAASGMVANARQLFEQMRTPGEAPKTVRVDHVDVRIAVLTALAEAPASGYEIVRLLEARGAGSPSAGAVYPMLQMLADEGLATVDDADGKKVYSLTDAGRVAAETVTARSTPREAPGSHAPAGRGALAKSVAQLAQTAALVAQTGTAHDIAESVAALDGARRALLSTLARN